MVVPPQSAGSFSRRSVLEGLGLSVLAVGSTSAMVGCGQDHQQSPQPTRTPSPATAQTVTKAKVPVGGGVVLERKYVVTQPSAGQFKAFTKVCPHQGCQVSFVKEGQIVCACHTSLFAIDTGQPTKGPAQTGLTEVPVKEAGDSLEVG